MPVLHVRCWRAAGTSCCRAMHVRVTWQQQQCLKERRGWQLRCSRRPAGHGCAFTAALNVTCCAWLQGEEATVVILSLVRSREDGNIGFLRLQVGFG